LLTIRKKPCAAIVELAGRMARSLHVAPLVAAEYWSFQPVMSIGLLVGF